MAGGRQWLRFVRVTSVERAVERMACPVWHSQPQLRPVASDWIAGALRESATALRDREDGVVWRLGLLFAAFVLAVTAPVVAQERPGELSKPESVAVGMVPRTLRLTWKPESSTLRSNPVAFPLLAPPALAQAPSASAHPISRRRAALIGAMVGGAAGAVAGTVYCASDCGGGRPRGALVFGGFGAGIGAAAGLLLSLLPGV